MIDALKKQLANCWLWLKTRQRMTLLAGGVIGAIVDDPLFAIVSALL